jgi:hypothetical protein
MTISDISFTVQSSSSPLSLLILAAETFDLLGYVRPEALVGYAPPSTGHPGTHGPASAFANSASAAASAVLPTTAMGAATTAYGAATTATAMLSNAFAGSYNQRFSANPLYNHNPFDNSDTTRRHTYHQYSNDNPVSLHPALLLDQQQHQQPSQYQGLQRPQQHQLPPYQAPPQQDPKPMFSLSRRLLAYASPVPQGSRTSSPVSTAPAAGGVPGTGGNAGARSNVGGNAAGGGGLGLPTTQAELGNAALRVGGSVLSGMRTLGGLAVSATRSRVSGGGEPAGVGGLTNRFFSRSAPADVDVGVREEEERRKRERRYSGTTNSSISGSPSGGGGGGGDAESAGAGVGRYLQRLGGAEGGCYVTVVDLATLGKGGAAEPGKVAEFMVAKDRPIAGLAFSSDGCAVLVAPRDGQVLQVYQIRPGPAVGGGGGDGDVRAKRASITGGIGRREARTPWHVYDLRRGRTSAVVEGAEWAEDGRWVAIGTRKRTVHVFAVNPYGGKPDHRSHLEGKVRNVAELVSYLCLRCISPC